MTAKIYWKKQRSPPNHNIQNNEKIVDGNNRKNGKAEDKESKEDYDDSTMECDFDLYYAGLMRNSWYCYPKRHV